MVARQHLVTPSAGDVEGLDRRKTSLINRSDVSKRSMTDQDKVVNQTLEVVDGEFESQSSRISQQIIRSININFAVHQGVQPTQYIHIWFWKIVIPRLVV
jgi:hypothetical protein